MQKLIREIRTITESVGLPYFEIHVFKGYDNVFSHVDKPADCAHKNKIFMHSCTKPITVVCALQLMEKGVLSPDDHVSRFIPAFAEACVLDENGNKKPVDTPVTIRHLLTMSAGFVYSADLAHLLEFCKRHNAPTTAAIVNAVAQYPLNFEPGSQFCYSFCLDVLARVIEVASGKRFAQYVQENIFDPLEMTNCSFHDDDTEHMLPQYIAQGSTIEPTDLSNHLVPSPNFDSGGAGLIGTAEDYAKFAVALANNGLAANGYRMLQPESVLMMRTPQIDFLSVENSFTCVQGADYSYGFGVRTRTAPTDFGLGVGEFGWDGAAGTYLMVDPNTNVSIVMGMHVRIWPNVFKDKHLEIVKKVYKTFDF